MANELNGARRYLHIELDPSGWPKIKAPLFWTRGNYIEELHRFISGKRLEIEGAGRRTKANLERQEKALERERKKSKNLGWQRDTEQFLFQGEDIQRIVGMTLETVMEERKSSSPPLPYDEALKAELAKELMPFITRGASLAAGIVLNVAHYFKHFELFEHARATYELVRDNAKNDASIELGAEAGLLEILLRDPAQNSGAIAKGFSRIAAQDPTVAIGRYEPQAIGKITRIRGIEEKTPADFLLRASYILDHIAKEDEITEYRRKIAVAQGNIKYCLEKAITAEPSLVEPALKIVEYYWNQNQGLWSVVITGLIENSAETRAEEKEKIHSAAVDYARQLRDTKSYELAIAICESVTALAPDNIHAHYFAGTAYEKMGEEAEGQSLGKRLYYQAAITELEQTGKGKTHTSALARVKGKLNALPPA